VRSLDSLARKAFAAAKPNGESPEHAAQAASGDADLRFQLVAKKSGAVWDKFRDDAERQKKWAKGVQEHLVDYAATPKLYFKATLFAAQASQSVTLRVFIAQLRGGRTWHLVDYTDAAEIHNSKFYYEVSLAIPIDGDDAVKWLLERWENDNRYFTGEVNYDIPDIAEYGIKARKGQFDTSGSASEERIARYLGDVSLTALVIAGVATFLLPVPLALPALVEAMMMSTLVFGVASGALTTFNRVTYDEQTTKDTVFDVLQVASFLIPGGAALWSRAAPVGNLAAFGAKVGLNRAVFYGEASATALNGILIAGDLSENLYNIITDDGMDPTRRHDLLINLLKSAVGAGLIVAIPPKLAQRELELQLHLAEEGLFDSREAGLESRMAQMKDQSKELVLKKTPGVTPAAEGKHERIVNTGSNKGKPAGASAARAQQPKPERKPIYKTTPMRGQYKGEHLPGNAQWRHLGGVVDYLDAARRQAYKLTIKDGKIYDREGKLFDTSDASTEHTDNPAAIFVMDEFGDFYASKTHSAGSFHHSSLLAGTPVAAAGEFVVINGELRLLSDRSGHYRPKLEFTQQALDSFKRQGVNLSNVELDVR